jgi:primosomal protein N' (replication factor Y)
LPARRSKYDYEYDEGGKSLLSGEACGSLTRVEVLVPGPWWNSLSYVCNLERAPAEHAPVEGARVRVPLGKGQRVGFFLGVSSRDSDPPENKTKEIIKIREILEILDDEPALGDDLWGLAGWIGKTFLCGMGEALQLICPQPLLKGEPLSKGESLPKFEGEAGAASVSGIASEAARDAGFRELSFFHPLDGERFAYYRELLTELLSSGAGRVLVLFPETRSASAFFAELPSAVKAESLLWPSTGGKKLWDAWKRTASGGARAVIGAPGAVFAPLNLSAGDTVIVDDESNPSYVFLRPPRVSARSLAGRRALAAKARLVLGGRMPGAKTYLRSRPKQPSLLPPRGHFVFVDMKRSVKAEVRGVEGELPLTWALLERTRETLAGGRHALWIMDRKGQAGEVYCSDCGASLFCGRCGALMRSEAVGSGTLRCSKCGARENLPLYCPDCRGTLLLGKRPGLEALLPLAIRYIKGYEVRLDGAGEARKSAKQEGPPSLVLGTRRILSLCDSIDVGLAAWLDLDAEARKVEYNARFQTFSMVWESYWRGRCAEPAEEPERLVLLQTRRPGGGWLNSFRLGWGRFWESELRERKELSLPPYELLVQVDLPVNEDREALVRSLERANLPVTSGGDSSPLWLSVKSTEPLALALAPRFEIRHSRAGFPVVTVWTE